MFDKNFTEQILQSIEDYFTCIENTGYMRYDRVYELLGLLLADTFLNTDLNIFITESDYRTISDFIYCIMGKNCLLSYPEFTNAIPYIGKAVSQYNSSIRITDSDIIRSDESKPNIKVTEGFV